MLSEDGAQTLFRQVHKLWIEPEISHRKNIGNLPEKFKICRCLIRLPKGEPPIVEFNGEIKWLTWAKMSPGISLKRGGDIYLHEIETIEAVSLPEVNGQRVAFVYIFWTGLAYSIIFDFTPNSPERQISDIEKDREESYLSATIAKSLQDILIEKTIHIHDKATLQLQKIGLCAAPALLPYPMSKIIKHLNDNDTEGAIAILREYCTPTYIEQLSSKWWDLEQLEKREVLIQDALEAHKEGKYSLSIHALLPPIEGIITDWMYTKLPFIDIPWRQKSKTKKFGDLVLDDLPTTFTYKRIVESAIEFIVNGPVLSSFKKWDEEINQAFPSRHATLHGKYDQSLFTEENSIKLFLIIDTIYYIILNHSNEEL